MSIFNTMTLPEFYERVLVTPLFRPFAEALLHRLQPADGDSLLDVACGTGIVARVARQRLGPDATVVGVDAAAPMLAVARNADTTIDWREGNAAALPLREGERFSMVTCHQGLQFFPDKAAAVRQMRGALRPGGRVGIGTWLAMPDTPLMREFDAVAQRHLGPFTDARHSFGDADALRAVLADAGFADIRTEVVAHRVRLSDGPTFARANANAVVGMHPAAKALDDAERAGMVDRIATDSMPAVAAYTRDGGVDFLLSTNLATARV